MIQKTALEILKMGQNVFLTGPAGSGKTFVLNQYIEYLRRQKVEVAVTASTGIAATHMNGVTIHSWSGLGIKESLTRQEAADMATSSDLVARYRKTKVLIIDEVSMLDADRLDAVEKLCRVMKDPFRPFGGLQVVLCGDFFQLPPVSKTSKGVQFAFESVAWQEMGLKVCYLEEQHRHVDERLTKLLNAIRSGDVTDDTHALLRERMDVLKSTETLSVQAAKLFTHNADVDLLNNRELLRIDGPAYAYGMKQWGKRILTEGLQKNCLAPERLVLKVGARVMFVKNNSESRYVNGTLGHVIRFDEQTKMPVIKTLSGYEIAVTAAEWQLVDGTDVIASIEQLPLRLAWAVTVHKSQGMSLDMAEIDLRNSFEYGMGYVALSRVRKLSGLFIRGINARALEVHPLVSQCDRLLLERSLLADREFSALSTLDRSNLRMAFAGVPAKMVAVDMKAGSRTQLTGLGKTIKKAQRVYRSWTEADDERLASRYQLGEKATALSILFDRTPGAIRSRLKKLGLKG